MTKIERIGNIGIRILLYLLEKGNKGANVSELISKLKIGKQTFYYRTNVLEIFGLIKKRKSGVERIYFLTDKGEKVAEHLKAVEDLLSQ